MATIFVADDNPHVHSMVEKSLGADGHEIAGTMVGSEALESIAQSKPDIVLLDSTLGELNAFDTCREVLSLPGMEELRVVLLAGPLETIDSTEALQAGVSTVLQKPLDPAVLSELVGDGGDGAEGSKSKPPAVDLLVHQALGDADSQQLRSAIHKQVEAVVNASIPSLVDHITDRLAEKLKPK
ncbi:MAG: response regulator [Bryobacterales bacterium]|nr:response regulator [Bryobacterales bacterium]MDE0622575.1 response regulator [Bryobacterales bacterium]